MIKPTLYLDMDGVLSDFDTTFANFLGVKKEDLNSKIIYKNFSRYISSMMFLQQDKLNRSEDLVMALLNYRDEYPIDICILTSCGMSPSGSVVSQKKLWLEKHFPQLDDIPFCTVTSGGAKSVFAGPEKFLLDDHHKNIAKFKANGGHGYIYTPESLENSINELHEFFKMNLERHSNVKNTI